MMPFHWTDQTLRWYIDASYFTGFHQRLASRIAPLLEGCARLADLGAGPGLLSMALNENYGERFPTILAMDADPLPLIWCEAEKRRRKLSMPLTLQSDCSTLAADWDAVIACFYGFEHLANYLPHCRRLIVVCHDDSANHFGSEQPNRDDKRNLSHIRALLDAAGASYEIERLQTQFGQPLREQQELGPYLEAMHNHSPLSLAEATSRLEATGDSRFPYYLPYLKHLAIFAVTGWLQR